MEPQKNSVKRFCISVDGSESSDYAFEMVFNELYSKGDQLIVCHAFSSVKDDTIVPFNYQVKTIMSKYETKLLGKLKQDDYLLISKEKSQDDIHALQTIIQIALKNNCTALIIGFLGHKANKQKDELSKGVLFIMNHIKIPTFIIKEKISRKDKKDGKFTWLVCLSKLYGKSNKAFNYVLDYVDHEKDVVIGYHIQSNAVPLSRDLQLYFEETCQKSGVKHYSFQFGEKQSHELIGDMVTEMINFGSETIDFCVIGHLPIRYKHVEESPAFTIMKKAQANVLFYS